MDMDTNSPPSSPSPEPLKTSGLAIASLICAFLVPPLGLVLGLLALRSIKSNPATGGKGIAIAGAVVSGVFSLMLVGLAGLIAAIAIPNIKEARNNAQVNGCKASLRTIDLAIAEWSLEKRQPDGAPVSLEDLRGYFVDGIPICPARGEYHVSVVGEKPTCTVVGHTLEDQEDW